MEAVDFRTILGRMEFWIWEYRSYSRFHHAVCPDWPLQTLLNGATDETEETEIHHASDQATILLEKERQGCEV